MLTTMLTVIYSRGQGGGSSFALPREDIGRGTVELMGTDPEFMGYATRLFTLIELHVT